MRYNIDFAKHMKRDIPGELRKDVVLALVEVVASDIDHVNAKLYAFYQDVKYRQQFIGQKCYLEHYLNDQFDPIARTIVVSHDSLPGNIDFMLDIPSALYGALNLNQVRSEVLKYRDTKRFDIRPV